MNPLVLPNGFQPICETIPITRFISTETLYAQHSRHRKRSITDALDVNEMIPTRKSILELENMTTVNP